MPHSRWFLPLLALFLCNCATLRTQLRYSGFGEADFSRDRAVTERFKDSRDEPAPQVKVLVDTVPEGLSVKDGLLRVEEGYSHEILGKFSLLPQNPVISIYAFADYEDGWRKVLCYPQIPLVWLTLSIWPLVPTFYPCYGSVTQRREKLLDDVKRITQAAQGDVAIVSFGLSPNLDPEEAFGAAGYILRLDPRTGLGKTQSVPKQQNHQL